MGTFNWPRGIVAAVLLGVTVCLAVAGNESLLPTAAVCLLLVLVSGAGGVGDRAARAAVAVYAGGMAALSLLISLFLRPVSDYFDLGGMYDGDFVRVTVNDSHEFAFAACVLLALQAVFGLILRPRKTK